MKVQSLLGHEDWIRGTNFALEGLLIYFLFTKCLESYDHNTHILLIIFSLECPFWNSLPGSLFLP